MLIKRIANSEKREQVLFSLLIREDNKHTSLIVGKKRLVEYWKYDLSQSEPSFIDSTEFSEDIIELKRLRQEVLVILNNLQMYTLTLKEENIQKTFSAVIRSFEDTPIARVKHTSCEISKNYDYGILSAFSQSLVILYFFDQNEGKEECKQCPSASQKLSIESSIKYYDFQVSSSLLIQSHDKCQDYLWHLDTEHNLIRSGINRHHEKVDIISREENFIHNDKTMIDISYLNKTHIALLQTNAVSFFNIQDLTVTSR